MEDETKLFYDLMAKKTADEWYKNNILLPTINDFITLLPDNPRILDLGCGTGHESMRLASTGADVIGIDYSPECIRIARERCPQCRFEVMDFMQLDHKFGEFDAVFACASLIHVTENLLETVVRKITELLKKDGYFLMIVQDGRGINEKWSTLEVNGKKLRREVYCFTKKYLRLSRKGTNPTCLK